MKLNATKYDSRGRQVGSIDVDILVSYDHQVDLDPYTRSRVHTTFAHFEYDLPFLPYSFEEQETEIVFFESGYDSELETYCVPYPPELNWYDAYHTEGGGDGRNLVLKAHRSEYLAGCPCALGTSGFLCATILITSPSTRSLS